MLIEGRNAVREALVSNVTVNRVMLADGSNKDLAALAEKRGIKFAYLEKAALDRLCPGGKHQGCAAETTSFRYSELNDLLKGDGSDFIVILDGVSDPHNFGSIIRVCECAGVNGIVIAKDRQVPVNDTVVRTSAGAVSHVKIARVTNLNAAIRFLKEKNVWVYAADMDGEPIYSTELKGSVALVVGGEDTGVRKLTKSLCDKVLSLPQKGKVNSLNASVACALAVYEVVRQRGNE